jgi:hypothetical protein
VIVIKKNREIVIAIVVIKKIKNREIVIVEIAIKKIKNREIVIATIVINKINKNRETVTVKNVKKNANLIKKKYAIV